MNAYTSPFTLLAPGRRQLVYLIFRFSIDLCFCLTVAWAYSLRPVSRLPFFRSYGVNLPSSLTTLLPLALGFSPHLPVSVCGTGTLAFTGAFLASEHRRLPYYISVPFAQLNQRLGSAISKCPSGLRFGGYGISTVCASTTPCGLALAPGLPWADEPSPRNLRFSAIMIPT